MGRMPMLLFPEPGRGGNARLRWCPPNHLEPEFGVIQGKKGSGKTGQGPNFVFHVPFQRCFFFHSRIFFGSSDSGFTANFLTCTDTLSALRIDKRAAIQDSFKDVFREIVSKGSCDIS
jgi:hypothetical protein